MRKTCIIEAKKIRIVKIADYDICACCGIHVARTGEIGIIKLIKADKYKNGTRITMLCGERALSNFNILANNVNKISNLLSIKNDETAEAVEVLYNTNKELSNKINILQNELFDNEIDIMQCEEIKIVFKENLDFTAIRAYCNKLKEKTKKICSVFCKDNGIQRYFMMSHSINLQPIVKELNARFQGKGGGKSDCVQGQLIGEEQEIRAFLEGIIKD